MELLLDSAPGGMGKEQRHLLEVVLEKTDTLIRLIRDVVALDEITSETLVLAPTSLAEVVGQSMQTLQPQADANSSIFIADWPADLPLAQVDRERLKLVFYHLLDNAIKFSPAGGWITISIRQESEGFLVAVSDTGIGISPDKLEKIFERFYQSDGSSTRRFGGMGIGLALARRIVEAHGGKIWAVSEPGKGSTFYFTLPRATATAWAEP